MKRREIFVILLFISVPVSFAQEIFEVPRTFDVSIEGEKEVYYYSGGNLIASQTNGLNYNYQDRLGSDVNSKTLPFGQEIISSERFSFTGKELDNELYYFGARYYDSNLGRFTAVDPMHETPYQYVGNNPLKYIDPTGMRSEEPGETTIRAYNIGISAAFPLIGGIYRGDPLKDILKNTAYGALTGLGSFEIKKYVSQQAENSLEFLGAGLVENFLSSVRSNAIKNAPALGDLQFDYLMFSFRYREGEGLEPGINLARTFDSVKFAIMEGNKFDIDSSLKTGVPIFTREAYGGTSLTSSGFAGLAGRHGGAISHVTFEKNTLSILRHEFTHNLQSKSMFGIGSAIGPNYNPKLFGIRLYGGENLKGNLLMNELPFYLLGGKSGPKYYGSNWNWKEREAYGLGEK